MRTIAPNTEMAPFFLSIVKQYKWTRVTVVVSADQEWFVTASAIQVGGWLVGWVGE